MKKGKKIPRGKKVNPKKIKPAPVPRTKQVKKLSHKTGTKLMTKTIKPMPKRGHTLKRTLKTYKKKK